MPENVTIRRLTAPTSQELDQVASVLTEALSDDSVTRSGSADDEKTMYGLHRSISAGTAAGACLLAAFLHDTQEIVGTISFYGSGIEICGDETQRSQGFDDFLKTLPESCLAWWGTFIPEYSKVSDALIGPGVKKAAWSINNFGVRASYRGRGIGRALLEAGEALARADDTPIIFEAEHKRNVDMYQHLGYKTLGEHQLKGGNGVADFTFTVLRKDFV